MAKLIGQFSFEHNYEATPESELEREQQWLKELSATLRAKQPQSSIVGHEVRWPRADGYARYIVVREKPLQLAHLDVDDAWQVEPELIRGLRVADVKEQIERAAVLSKIFSNRTD